MLMNEVINTSANMMSNMLKGIRLPKMARVRQRFPRPILTDIAGSIYNEINKPEIKMTIQPGQKIALTVGSRGIRNIAQIIKELVKEVKKLGGHPFIVPAMGSHGGATTSGQLQVLNDLGITEQYMEAPIKASMEVIKIGDALDGKPVVIDKFAAEADGIIVIGRIKPHTAFRGKYESGLMKMLVIGLGKQKGADICHAEGFKYMADNIVSFGKVILEKANILFGMAILENPYDETYKITALTKQEIPLKEPVLLEEAKALMPKIMFESFDVLIIDEIGKNISGDGMDPNITATYCTPYARGGPHIQRVVVLDLTKETHGNAFGVGMADITTKRLYQKTDFTSMYANAITNTVIHPTKMPMFMNSDREAIAAAIKTCNEIDKNRPKVVRIKNTLHLDELYISEALGPEAEKNPDVEILESPKDFAFDEQGNLFS